ncbi:MAG: chromosome segregation protein SMC [Streptococcaceae bacterium]|jgi:chromosome segregation protein|nr:chromosome segregation protein SMC [Streptococcaceae bacterium]
MHLKRLEIHGFKSFADRTKIEFDHGITAVVGPNGSGKSNITEALRWALGEQSAKSLRGGKMPDVIFAGTEKRKAQNFAEVTAHFDNSDHYLDSDEKEVVITRRLYRNGDSEFLINGKKKRLKDIHDMFMDTGLGRDSFSIISQGRIESVFSSKPEERRAIIEEAAGVLKFKSRKVETETKLKGMQDNLDRLEDIIYELSGQLPALKGQRDVALEFQTLDASRQKLALSALVAHVKQARKQYDLSSDTLQNVTSDLQKLSESQKDFEAELQNLKNQRDQAEKDREILQSQVLQLTELKSELEKQIERFDRAMEDRTKSDQAKAEQTTDLTKQKSEAEIRLVSNNEKLEILQGQKTDLDGKIHQLEKELADFSESPELQMEKLRESYLSLVNKESSLSNQLTKNQSDAENLLRQQSESDSSAKENTEKLAEISSELLNLKSHYETQKSEINKILSDFQEKNQELQNLKTKRAEAESVQYKTLEQYNKQRAQLNSLENIRDNHSNLYAGVRAAMRAQLSGLIGVVADLLSFDNRYEIALEVALGAGAQNIITENEQDAQAAIRYLRENKQGRATFLPLTTVKYRDFRDYQRVSTMTGFIDLASNLVSFDEKLRPAISSLLGTTIIVDNGDNATAIARAMNFSVRIVTLDGTLLSPGGSYSGGSRQNRNNSTFIANEIEQLKKEVVGLEVLLREKESVSQELAEQEKALAEALAELREQGEQKRLLEKEVEMRVKQLQQQKDDLEELLSLSSSPETEASIKELKQKNLEIEQELTEIAQWKDEANAELDLVKSSSDARQTVLSEKSATLTNFKVELSKVNSELNFARTEVSRFEAELSRVNLGLESLQNSETIEINETERESLQQQLEETSQKLQDCNVKQVSLRFAREDFVAQIEDLESQNSEAREENQTLHDKKTRLELQIEQLENNLWSAQQSLSEEYQLSFDAAEAQSDSIEESELSKSEKDLRGLERQIRGLGPINLDAIQQYEEVQERYAFLDGQKSDLLESKNLLLTTMNQMDDEVRIRFKATYDEVRASFKQTFSQMFGGGETDLILTGDNLLDAGIDILAQPPGKRLGSLTLMSGGEKALTALALLFAILRVRTVPFVVLDEVEAALDEANVKRFGDYMNHFDNSNQFIVVTHRKGTMAAAQVMYGVTMSEAGVSKLVSVRFDSSEKQG